MDIEALALTYCKLNLIQQYQFKKLVKEIQTTGGVQKQLGVK